MAKAYTDREAAIAVYHFRKGWDEGCEAVSRSIVGRQIPLDAQITDQSTDLARGFRRAVLVIGLRIGLSHFAGILQYARRLLCGCANVREDQALKRVDPVRERNCHSIAPSLETGDFAPGSEEMRIARAVVAHRLSENRK